MSKYTPLRNSNLNNLVQKLETEQLVKRDLIVPSRFITAQNGNLLINDLPADLFDRKAVDDLLKEFGISTSSEGMPFELTDNALVQLSDKSNIPIKFMRYILSDHVDLFDHNVSTLLERAEKNYLIRSFAPVEGSEGKGLLRAFLSDRFSMVDHLDVLYASLGAIKDAGANVEIGKCNLTEQSMYVEFMNPDAKITSEEYLNRYRSPDGGNDPYIYSGFVISNSETGNGRYKIVPRAIVGACDNGLLFKRDMMASTHVGQQLETGIQWSQRTRDKEVDLIGSQIQDAVNHFMSEDFLKEKVTELGAYNDRLEHPIEAITRASTDLMISKDEQKDILNYFIDSGDFSPVGAMQAFTYHAHEIEDADRQYEIEGKALELVPKFADLYDYKEN